MPLADILEKILADAHAAAEEKRRSAKEKASEIDREADAKIAEIESDFSRQQAEKTEKIKRKAHSLALTHRKSALSEAKQKVFAEVLAEAEISFTRLPEAEREKIYTELLKEISPSEKGTLFPAQGEKEILASSLKKAGIDATFGEELAKEKGGFLFSSPTLDADARLSLLLEKESFPKVEKEISSILFSE